MLLLIIIHSVIRDIKIMSCHGRNWHLRLRRLNKQHWACLSSFLCKRSPISRQYELTVNAIHSSNDKVCHFKYGAINLKTSFFGGQDPVTWDNLKEMMGWLDAHLLTKTQNDSPSLWNKLRPQNQMRLSNTGANNPFVLNQKQTFLDLSIILELMFF
jgi:hypothetical protein